MTDLDDIAQGCLTSVAKVRDFLQLSDGTAADQNDLIADLITRASEAIMAEAAREFAQPASGPLTRTYVYDGSTMLYVTPYDLRSVETITITDWGGNTDTLDESMYRLLPQPSRVGTYTHLDIDDAVTPGFLNITGLWGFPSIPPDVEQVCIDTVEMWYSRNRQAAQSDDSGATRYGPVLLPSSARMVITRYRLRKYA